MDPQIFYTLLAEHKYALFLAAVVGFLVRILKSDTKIPIDIPPAYRKYLALALALGGAVVEKYATTKDWKAALLDGLIAWFFAEWGHKLVIEDLRSGRELAIPGLIRPGARPAPGKPPSLPPMSVLTLMILPVLIVGAVGCRKFYQALDIAADKAACVVAYQDLPPEVIAIKCAIQPGDFERYEELLSEARYSTKRALERQAAASTWVDAGADGGGKDAGGCW